MKRKQQERSNSVYEPLKMITNLELTERRWSVDSMKKIKEKEPWRAPSSRDSISRQSRIEYSAPIPVPSRRRSVSLGRGNVTKSFAQMKVSSNGFVSKMKARKCGILRTKAAMKSHDASEEEVFVQAISLCDKSVFVQLIQQLLSRPISLKLAATILPELRFLFSHKNSTFIDTALDILDQIVTEYKETIKEGLALRDALEFAAKQRQNLCHKCKEALTEIYVNVPLLNTKFDEEQHLYFNSILDKFMELVS